MSQSTWRESTRTQGEHANCTHCDQTQTLLAVRQQIKFSGEPAKSPTEGKLNPKQAEAKSKIQNPGQARNTATLNWQRERDAHRPLKWREKARQEV